MSSILRLSWVCFKAGGHFIGCAFQQNNQSRGIKQVQAEEGKGRRHIRHAESAVAAEGVVTLGR